MCSACGSRRRAFCPRALWRPDFRAASKLGLGKCRLMPSAHRYRYRTWKQQPRYRAYRARCSVLRHRRTSHLPTRLDVGVPWRVSSYAPNLRRTGALTVRARRCNCASPLPRILRPTSLPILHASCITISCFTLSLHSYSIAVAVLRHDIRWRITM